MWVWALLGIAAGLFLLALPTLGERIFDAMFYEGDMPMLTVGVVGADAAGTTAASIYLADEYGAEVHRVEDAHCATMLRERGVPILHIHRHSPIAVAEHPDVPVEKGDAVITNNSSNDELYIRLDDLVKGWL